MLKKILIGGAVALTVYVVNEMRKEWDKMANDYNELADFVESCDFYRYQDGSDTKSGDEKHRFVTETEEADGGFVRKTKRDKVSGFSVLSYERA